MARELEIEHGLSGTVVRLDGQVIARGAIPQRMLDELIAQYRAPAVEKPEPAILAAAIKLREDALEQMKELLNAAGDRALTAEEHKDYVALSKQVEYLHGKIDAVRRMSAAGTTIRSADPNELLAAPEPPAERERTFGVEPLLGWRVWTVRRYETLDGRVEPRLAPITDFLLWQPHQRVTALCTKYSGSRFTRHSGSDHEAPHPDCSCGLWAVDRTTAEDMYVARQAAVDSCVSVFGQVAMWGRVLEFERGFRAQYAYPTVLYGYTDHEELVRGLGAIYGVPARILPGRIGPPDPGETVQLAATGQQALAAFRQAGVTADEFAKALQKMNKAIAGAIGPITISAGQMRKLADWVAEQDAAKEPDFGTLAAHAFAGSHVFDVYTTAERARHGVDEFVAGLEAGGTRHRRVHRFRVIFPSGGTYDAIGAQNEEALMRHLRGRRVDVIDIPPGCSQEIRGYLNATGATILP